MKEEKLSLKDLHLSARYSLNAKDLVNILANNFEKMLSQPIGVERLQLFCHHLFYKILGDTLDLNEFFNGKRDFYETTEKLSFEKKLSKLGYNEEIGQELDKVAFKIFDFAFCSTNEKQIEADKKLFGDWSYRVPQMLFVQKGQLWVLNILNNTAKWAKGKSKEEIHNGIKKFLREAIDLDFSPYINKATNQEVIGMISEMSEHGQEIKAKYKHGVNNSKILNIQKNRMLGFELECQLPHKDADKLYATSYKSKTENPSVLMLTEIHKMFKNSNHPILQKASMKSEDVIEKGSIVRDGSNIKYPGYIAFEYSSPLAKGGLPDLKANVNALCDLLEKNGGGLVREDGGTHLHVSIEDILPSNNDSKEVAEEKLNAIKRIFINFILVQDKIESILPEYRRADNSWFSGQTYDSYVKGNKNFMIGLIDSVSSYKELTDVLMVGGKYLTLAPFKDNIEFRTFPATTNPETLNTWFELLNNFVENSIKGLPAEKCIDQKLFNKLAHLTQYGSRVDGKIESQDICHEGFNTFTSPIMPRSKINKILNYTKTVLKAATDAGAEPDPLLTGMPIAVSPDRVPGERPNPNMTDKYNLLDKNNKLFVAKNKTKSFVQKYLDQKNNNNIHTIQSA